MTKNISIKSATQLAIFIPDRPGMLAQICDGIANAKINIDALATEGVGLGSRGDEMLVRMVVSDPIKTLAILGESGAVAVQANVLLIEGRNEPGMLGRIAERLGKSDINIESIYLSASSDAKKCVIILRPSNVEQATRILREL